MKQILSEKFLTHTFPEDERNNGKKNQWRHLINLFFWKCINAPELLPVCWTIGYFESLSNRICWSPIPESRTGRFHPEHPLKLTSKTKTLKIMGLMQPPHLQHKINLIKISWIWIYNNTQKVFIKIFIRSLLMTEFEYLS